MGTAKNKTVNLQLNIDLGIMLTLGLTINEYSVAYFIKEKMSDPDSQVDGWTPCSKEEISRYLKLSKMTVFRILKKLHDKGLVERLENTKYVRTTTKWYQYTNGTPSIILVSPIPKEKESSKEKEYINIPVSTKQDDVPPKRGLSCPLKDPNNPLREKYPRGHEECVEYVTSFKFVNKGKQFRFLHQMLRSGLDFPDIDRIIARVEKKPYFQENGYDFATLAGEADRRANARS